MTLAKPFGALLTDALLTDPGQPRVTYYGPDGERLEFSGKVLRQWAAKTSNALVEEADVEPGATVAITCREHWLPLVAALAAWAVGAEVSDAGDADVLVTAAEPATPADTVGALALAPLARGMGDQPPWWDVDIVAAVTACADDPLYDETSTPTAPQAGSSTEGARLLRHAEPSPGPATWRELAEHLLGGGSVVIVDGDAHNLDRVRTDERVTGTWEP